MDCPTERGAMPFPQRLWRPPRKDDGPRRTAGSSEALQASAPRNEDATAATARSVRRWVRVDELPLSRLEVNVPTLKVRQRLRRMVKATVISAGTPDILWLCHQVRAELRGPLLHRAPPPMPQAAGPRAHG